MSEMVWDWDKPIERRKPQVGDFSFSQFVLKDMSIVIKKPNSRDIEFAIFHLDSSRFRQQWMMYDLMSSNFVVGLYDQCLFSVRRITETYLRSIDDMANAPSTLQSTMKYAAELGIPLLEKDRTRQQSATESMAFLTHFKVTGLSIDLFNQGITGPLNWTKEGTVDMDSHVLMHPEPYGPNKIQQFIQVTKSTFSGVANRLLFFWKPREDAKVPDTNVSAETAETSLRMENSHNDPSNSSGSNDANNNAVQPNYYSGATIFLDVNFNNVKAVVPLEDDDWSYLDTTKMRPIVSYINSNFTLLTVFCVI